MSHLHLHSYDVYIIVSLLAKNFSIRTCRTVLFSRNWFQVYFMFLLTCFMTFDLHQTESQSNFSFKLTDKLVKMKWWRATKLKLHNWTDLSTISGQDGEDDDDGDELSMTCCFVTTGRKDTQWTNHTALLDLLLGRVESTSDYLVTETITLKLSQRRIVSLWKKHNVQFIRYTNLIINQSANQYQGNVF